jgi:hypothetical protein
VVYSLIRKSLNLKKDESVFMFNGDMLIMYNMDFREIYERKKDTDGFLYIYYSETNPFWTCMRCLFVIICMFVGKGELEQLIKLLHNPPSTNDEKIIDKLNHYDDTITKAIELRTHL